MILTLENLFIFSQETRQLVACNVINGNKSVGPEQGPKGPQVMTQYRLRKIEVFSDPKV